MCLSIKIHRKKEEEIKKVLINKLKTFTIKDSRDTSKIDEIENKL